MTKMVHEKKKKKHRGPKFCYRCGAANKQKATECKICGSTKFDDQSGYK